MTTYTLTGYQVTQAVANGPATAVVATTLTLATTNAYEFRYTLNTPVAGNFSRITMQNASGELLAATLGATRVNLNTVGSMGVFDMSDRTLHTGVLKVATANPLVSSYFVVGGAALPPITNLTQYNDAMAKLVSTTSVIPSGTLYSPNRDLSVVNFISKTATSDNDLITGNAAFDSWVGKTISTGAGNDTVNGLTTNDKISLDTGNDVGNGNAGNDTIAGGSGNDSLTGAAGNDLLQGGSGNDTLDGGADNDKLVGGSGNDSVLGGDGDDLMKGNSGNDFLNGDLGADTIDGGTGADTIQGGNANDVLKGGSGNDNIDGGLGDDKLLGGTGADTINGGAGDDKLSGGTGEDVFVFSAGFGNDYVTQFANDKDTLQFASAVAATVAQAMAAGVQEGRDVVFTFGANEVTVHNILLAQLSDDISII